MKASMKQTAVTPRAVPSIEPLETRIAPAAVLSILDATLTEGNAGTTTMTVTVQAVGEATDFGSPVTVEYFTAPDGTAKAATAGTDFTAIPQSMLTILTFDSTDFANDPELGPSKTLEKSFTVDIAGDTGLEADETFSLKLANPTGGGTFTGGADTATGTITNDEKNTVQIVSAASLTETDAPTDGTMNFAVTAFAEGAPTAPITVKYSTSVASGQTATPGTDFTTVTNSTLTFAVGDFTETSLGSGLYTATKQAAVTIKGDGSDESDETFTVTLTDAQPAAGTEIKAGSDKATGTILDDDNVTILADNKTATFKDVDGDTVTVKITAGTLTDSDFTLVSAGVGKQLQKIALQAAESGANLTITAVRSFSGGDGFVNVGHIDATGVDLGAVTVNGDLGQIDAGENTTDADGVTSLTVNSMGRFGTSTQASGGDLNSDIVGNVTTFTVKSSIVGSGSVADIDITGDLGTLAVTGNVRNANVNVSGKIGGSTATAVSGGATIKGSVISGELTSGGLFSKLSVAGSVEDSVITSAGGFGITTASGVAGGIGIKGNVAGSSISASGASGLIATISVAGNLDDSDINAGLKIGTVVGTSVKGGVVVKGSVLDGSEITSAGLISSISVTGNLYSSDIYAVGNIGQLNSITSLADGITVKGSIFDSSIGSQAAISKIQVTGDVRDSGIRVKGNSAPNGVALAATVIGKLAVSGSVEGSDILGGYDADTGMASNPNVRIGPVSVGGDWVASSLVAGINDVSDDGFGDDDDAVIGGGTGSDTAAADTLATIASVIVKGYAIGTVAAADHFGFIAEKIDAFKVGPTMLTMTAGTENFLIGATSDLRVREYVVATT